jgi:hypothetical protein
MAAAGALLVAATRSEGWLAQAGIGLSMALGGLGGGMWLRRRERPQTVEDALVRLERRRPRKDRSSGQLTR